MMRGWKGGRGVSSRQLVPPSPPPPPQQPLSIAEEATGRPHKPLGIDTRSQLGHLACLVITPLTICRQLKKFWQISLHVTNAIEKLYVM